MGLMTFLPVYFQLLVIVLLLQFLERIIGCISLISWIC